ncbi:MAG: hypothetical protein ABIQ01_11255 [Pseudolysinimonas sp.]
MKLIKYALAGALAAVIVVVGVATPAVAVTHLAVVFASDPAPIFVFDGIPLPIVIGLVTGTVIPAIVGLLSRLVDRVSSSSMSPLAKGVVLSGLAVLSGAITSVSTALSGGQPINLGILVATTASAFIMAVATYFGLLSRPSSRGNSIAGAIKGE